MLFEAHRSHTGKDVLFLFLLTMLSTPYTIYPICQLNTPNIKINHSTLRRFSQ